MPPKRAKKNVSTASDDAIPSFPAPATAQPTQPGEAHTPEQSPRKQATGITQAQKQALIDNLQLEITERARKLRAQYALQAQALRSRLEMRVNRIPTALRKRKIQDLLDEHAEKAEPKPAPAVPAKETVQRDEAEERPRKAVKRTSKTAASFEAEDKENTAPPQSSHSQSQPQSHDLPVTKKRTTTKTPAATANTKAARTASRANNANSKPLQPSTVLSPKSHNSRTLPRSPFKPSATMSPEKPRPVTTAKGPTTATAGRAASRQQQAQGLGGNKKLAPPPPKDREQRSSGVSDSSSGTTIVHKEHKAATGTGVKGKVTAAVKKTAAVGKAAAARKGTGKKENVPPPAAPTTAGGRTLRKRG